MHVKNLRHILILALLGASIQAFVSCNDQPTEVGTIFLPDTLQFITLSSDTAALISEIQPGYRRRFILEQEPMYNTGSIFVGETETGLRAVSFAKLSFPIFLGDTSSYTIESANLVIRPQRAVYGDTVSNFLSFDFVELAQRWTGSFTYDSLIAGEESGGLYVPTPVVEYQGTISYTETTISSLRFPVDKQTVEQWLVKAADTTTAKDIFGFAFRPRSGTNVVREFANTAGDALLRLEIVVKYPPVQGATTATLDTLQAVATETMCLINEALPEQIVPIVQGGIAIRSRVRFDVSSIPPFATVHRAELRFFADTARSRYGTLGREDSVLIRIANTDTALVGAPEAFTYAVRPSTTGTMFQTTNLAFVVERWLRRPQENYGVILQAAPVNETFRLNRTQFYGLNDPEVTRRPSLLIYYSLPPRP